MNRDFINEMNLEEVKKYERPFVITFVALPGSGKTEMARELSKKLKIYLLANDYIRNYYYQFTKDYSEEKRTTIENKVKEIQLERIKKLVNNKVSFILDECFNDEESYDKLRKNIGDEYKIYKIKINSNDELNIKNISNINMDYDYVFDGVIGDNVEYLSSFPSEVYYQIKERKQVLISDDDVDFVVNNISDIKKLEKNLINLID